VAEALDLAVDKDAPNADPYGVVLWPAAVPVAAMVASLVILRVCVHAVKNVDFL
jgi:hypothetical protein